MRVLLFSKYSPLGASSRLRSYQYLPFLKRVGIQVDVSALFDDHYLKVFFSDRTRDPVWILRCYLKRALRFGSLASYDLIWIEKELFPWFPPVFEAQITKSGIPFIVDYDDAVFHRYDRNSNGLIRKALGHKIDRIMRAANAVIAGNPYLAQRTLAAGASCVEQIPTVVDLERYPHPNPRNSTNFTIGWIGTPHTARNLKRIEPALQEITSGYKIKVVTIGAGNQALRKVSFQNLPWSEECEVSMLSSFDVGIMPLPDEPFERGKCGYKLIQYMACGVPVIASPVGVNTEIVEPGRNGFLASSTNQWVDALERLICAPQKARKMGREGRRKVEENYCLQVTAPVLARVIRNAAR